MGNITRQVINHALANGGLITTAEAQALGMTRHMISTRVSDGILIRRHRGILALAGSTDRETLDLEAACRRLNAVVSHESAARLHGFSAIAIQEPSVSVYYRGTHRFPDVTVHQSTDLQNSHLVTIGSLRVTNPERTVIDLASRFSQKRLEHLVDNALAAGQVDLESLKMLFDQLARRGKPGVAKLRRVIEIRQTGYVAPESELERKLLELIAGSGLPDPIRQFSPEWLVHTSGRVDLAYVDQRLLIEADGRRWHLLEKAFEVDRERDRKAQLAGWRVLRFTWSDVVRRPYDVVSEIRLALDART